MTFFAASVAEYCLRASEGVSVSIGFGWRSFSAASTFAMSGSAVAFVSVVRGTLAGFGWSLSAGKIARYHKG